MASKIRNTKKSAPKKVNKTIKTQANKTEKKSRSRKWTEEELEKFAEVLTDEENCFALNLERLALKKASNNNMFIHIKQIFKDALNKNEFKELNESKNFTSSDGVVSKYEKLDISIEKLRKKYTNLKVEWRKISDRVKVGSGLAPEVEPKWFHIINPVFSETNADLDLAAESADLSFSETFNTTYNEDLYGDSSESDGDVSDEANDELSTQVRAETVSLKRQNESNSDESDTDKQYTKKAPGKMVVAPHKKRKAVRSQSQALSQLAQSVEKMATAQMKRHKESLEVDRKRDELFLKFKMDEAEKNRQHELKMAELFFRSGATANHPPNYMGMAPSPQQVPYYNPSRNSKDFQNFQNLSAYNFSSHSPAITTPNMSTNLPGQVPYSSTQEDHFQFTRRNNNTN